MSGKTYRKKVSEEQKMFEFVETKYEVSNTKKRQWRNDGSELRAKRRQTNFSMCKTCASWGYANNRLPANAIPSHYKNHMTMESPTATQQQKYNAQRLLSIQRNIHNFQYYPSTRTIVEPKYYLEDSLDEENEPAKQSDDEESDDEEEPEEKQENDDDNSYVASASASDDSESSGKKFRARTARILIKHMENAENVEATSSQPQTSNVTDFVPRPHLGFSFCQPVQSSAGKKSAEESVAAKEPSNMSVSSTPELLSSPSSQSVANNQLLDMNSTQDIIKEAHNLITRKGEIERVHKEKIAKLDTTKEKFNKILLQLELEREVEIANKQKLIADLDDKYKAVAVLLLKELQK